MNIQTLLKGFIRGYKYIEERKEELDRINVFPLPDNDTGSNLVSTLKEAIQAIELNDDVFEKMVDTVLYTAQGNSGIILSQFLVALYEEINSKDYISPEEFRRALKRGVEAAYSSLEEPREGTILTVMRAFESEFARSLKMGENLEVSLLNALKSAERALENTKYTLEVLKDADVVDAGGLGFYLFIKGVVEEITREGEEYELLLTLKTKEDERKLKEILKTKGRFISILTRGNLKRIHIHTAHPEDVIETLKKLGSIEKKEMKH